VPIHAFYATAIVFTGIVSSRRLLQNPVMSSSRKYVRGGEEPTGNRKWSLLRPVRRFAIRMYSGFLVAIVWFLLVVTVPRILLHSLGMVGTIITALLLLTTLAPLAFAGHALLVYRNFDDAKLFVDRADIFVGAPFKVKIEQNVRRSLHIPDMRLALLCQETSPHTGADGKEQMRTRMRMEKWETITREKTIEGSKRLSATRQMTVPTDQPPSSPPEQTGPPLISWKFRLITAAGDGLKYDVEFPVFVKPRPVTQAVGEDEIIVVPPPEEWRRR
jgi:hypothetical protein